MRACSLAASPNVCLPFSRYLRAMRPFNLFAPPCVQALTNGPLHLNMARFWRGEAVLRLQLRPSVWDGRLGRFVGSKGLRGSAPRRKKGSCRPRAQEGKNTLISMKRSRIRFLWYVLVFEIVS